MRNKGFTLLELLIVVIVIAVLATIALPQFGRVAEQGKEAKARTNCKVAAEAERMSEAQSGAYTDAIVDGAFGASALLLGDLDADPDWNYAMVTDNAAVPPTFTITATRNGGAPNGGETITLNQSGVWGGDYANDGV